MQKELFNVFNIILTLKGTKKEPYIIDSEDMFIIYNYWYVYGLNKYLTAKKFRKIIVEYAVESGLTIHKSCEDLCQKIIFDNKNNNK